MDPDLQNSVQQPVQPVVNPVMQPQAPQQPVQVQQPAPATPNQAQQPEGKPVLKIILVLLIIIGATAGLVYVGYSYLNVNNNKTTTHNAAVYSQPTSAITSTPSTNQSNLNDTTDNAITKDAAQTNTDINNLNTDINNVDQSLNDQQTNLQ